MQLRAGLAGGVGRAFISEILSHRWIDARIDPRCAGRRTIIFQFAEACEVLIRIGGLKAVELL